MNPEEPAPRGPSFLQWLTLEEVEDKRKHSVYLIHSESEAHNAQVAFLGTPQALTAFAQSIMDCSHGHGTTLMMNDATPEKGSPWKIVGFGVITEEQALELSKQALAKLGKAR